MFDHPFDSRIKLTRIPLITKLTSMYEMHPTHNFFHYIYVMSMVSSKWKKVEFELFSGAICLSDCDILTRLS